MYNVMIVDDESIIRKGLLSFVDWEALECEVICEASNGFEAKEKLGSVGIDILITDIKMPGMDGLELSKFVYENYPDIKIIILTAFAEFSYAQSAIKYNVVDFIIKTNPSEKVPEAINKAKALIAIQMEKEDKIRHMEEALYENLSVKREKIIKDIFNGIVINPEIIETTLKEMQIAFSSYFVITYEVGKYWGNEPFTSSDEYNKFIFSVNNFLLLAFKDYRHYTFILKKNLLITVAGMDGDNLSACIHSLLITCNEILEFVDSLMKLNLTIGISDMHKSPFELPIAYGEALAAYSSSFFSGSNISLFSSKSEIHSSGKPIETHKYNDEILKNIQKADINAACSCLSELFSQYKERESSVERIKVSSMFLCSLCYRLLINYKFDISEYGEMESKIYNQIQESKSMQSLFTILTGAIKAVSDIIAANEKQCNYLVKEVNNYIHENYNKDINLQSISDYLHVNSSYLSRLYKKCTNESIIDMLNRLRIEKAKSLLTDPGKKIFEVASEVGIEDATYFTHVFTKYVGVSPKEFKARI